MHVDLGLGKLIETPQQRDAIHVAVAPVVAVGKLYPGQDIGFVEAGDTEKVGTHSTRMIGIVDPFLKSPVFDGQRFWMFVYPQTVTGMRHEWQHPAFEAEAAPTVDKAASLQWMEEFAAKNHSHSSEYYDGMGRNYTAADLLELAEDFLRTGDRHVQQGSSSLRDYTPVVEFWHHFEVITGTKIGDHQRGQVPFCCTC
jgi:hypothetical protein